MTVDRRTREHRALTGWVFFILALATALIAIWQQDGRWIATSGVFLVAAGAFGIGSWS